MQKSDKKRVLCTAKSEKITVSNEAIGAGAEGKVYPVVSSQLYADHCVKLYDNPQSKQRKEKILYMISNSPSRTEGAGYRICWPIETVFDRGRHFVGFLMPMAFPKSIQLYELCTPTLIGNLGTCWERKFDRKTGKGVTARLKLCVNIAIVVHKIHSLNDYVIVDCKPQNILVSPSGQISIVDLDSMQIAQGGDKIIFPGGKATPEYMPPEKAKPKADVTLNKSWDRFALAIVFYQLLFGLHPFAATATGRYKNYNTLSEKILHGLFVHGPKTRFLQNTPPPHKNFYLLSQKLQELFHRAFDHNPRDRPSAEEWGKQIYAELQRAQRADTSSSKSQGQSSSKSQLSRPAAPVPTAAKPSQTSGATRIKSAAVRLRQRVTTEAAVVGIIVACLSVGAILLS